MFTRLDIGHKTKSSRTHPVKRYSNIGPANKSTKKTKETKTFNLPYLMHYALGSGEVAGEESPLFSSFCLEINFVLMY